MVLTVFMAHSDVLVLFRRLIHSVVMELYAGLIRSSLTDTDSCDGSFASIGTLEYIDSFVFRGTGLYL